MIVGTGLAGVLGFIGILAAPGAAMASPAIFPPPYVSHFSTVTNVGSTVPANGDVNPYGITVVPSRWEGWYGATP